VGGEWKRKGEKEAGMEVAAAGAEAIRETTEGEKCTLSISLNKEGFSASLAEVAGWRRDASVPRLLIHRLSDRRASCLTCQGPKYKGLGFSHGTAGGQHPTTIVRTRRAS